MIYCLGLVYGQNGLTDSSFRFTPIIMLQMFMLSFPICLFIFGLNDVYDQPSDRINPRKKGLEGIRLDPSYHDVVKMGSLVAGIAFLGIAMATGNLINIYFAITILCLAYVYSVPPWRLKIRAPFDVISAGILGFFAPFALAYSLVDDVKTIPFQVYYFTLCVMGLHAFSTIMDYTVDQCVGDQTFAVTFGKRIAALFPAVIFLCTPFFIHVMYIRIFFMFCLFLCIVVTFIPSEKLARYSFLTMFIGTFSVLSIWILWLCYDK